MAGELIRFEWRFHTRQAAFLVAVAAFLGMAFVFVGTGHGPDNAHVNSPASVMQSLGFLSLFSVFVLSAFCANAALRDSEHRMEALVYATPVSKLTYLSVRLVGALLAALAVFTVTTLGLMLAPWVLDVAPERRGSWEALRYAWALAVMVLPNLLFAASLLFAVATLTRSALATHVGAVFLYALYFVGALLGDSPLMAGTAPQTPEALARAALLDPFGLSAFFAQTRHWTGHERNTRLLPLEGAFLHNRLLWLGVSAGVLVFVYRRFSFRAASGAKPRSIAPGTAPSDSAVPYRPVETARDAGARFRAALVSTWKVEARALLKSRAFLALMALWVFVLGMEVTASAMQAEYRTRLLPTTGLLLQAIQPPLLLFGALCVVYFGAELAWRERGVRLSELLDATPASSAVFYLAKLAVLALQLLVLTVSAVGIAVLYQLARGHRPLEPALYLSLLYFSGLPLLLFAVAVLWLQTLSPHRYVGMFLGLLLALAMRQGGLVGLEHGLLRYASGPPLRYSDMNGFGASVHGFNAYMVYWSALAGVLGLLTWGLWRRGVSPPLRARVAALPQVWGRRGLTAVAACLALFVLAGGFIFHGTNVLNRYETRAQLAAWKADYEKTYQRYESLPQPSVVAVKARVDLYPEAARYHAAGRYVLENRTQAPIQRVWLSVRRDVRHATLALQGARQVHHDSRFGMSAFELDTPLPPGARTELTFTLEMARRGIREGARDTSIAGNGSFISNQEAFPTIGYRKGYELDDARERRQRGLPETPRVAAEAAGDLGLAEGGGQRAWTTLDLTVSTPDTQLAVAPGELRQAWNEEGRRVFRYVMERPIRNWFALVSARYAVKQEHHRGVDVAVYYHPGHAQNVERMLRAATRSLDVLEAQLGGYPHRQLRIVEVPSTWGFGALALSNTLYYPEHRGFLTAPGEQDTVDLITRRIGHEVAHQWWGHQVDPVSGPGGLLITESLAKYAEQRVLKALHGEDQVHQVLAFDLDRYLRGRAEEDGEEPPLLQVTDEPYLYYGKGAVVMHALADLLGEAALDRALRKLVQQHAHPKPQPTARDLLALLHEEAAEEARPLVDQWLTQVVLYDLEVEAAAVEPLANGRYRVTARLSASKHARQNGQDVRLPMDESLDVAVLSQDATLYAAKHRFTGGATEVSLIVDQRPASLRVDPFLRRVSRERTGAVWTFRRDTE